MTASGGAMCMNVGRAGVHWKRGVGGREGGLAGPPPCPPTVPSNPAPKAPEKLIELKPSCAKGVDENFASKSGRGGRGVV